MKALLLRSSLGLMLCVGATPLAPQPSLRITIPLPPPIVFPAPPSVVILPETRVYAVPDAAEEIFFTGGWWWRPWNGRWYRSHHYDRGWVHYGSVPSWYRGIPRGWRDDYRGHSWGGGAWNHRPIHHDDLQRNWKEWHASRHWDQPQHRQHEPRREGRPSESREHPGKGHGQHKPDRGRERR